MGDPHNDQEGARAREDFMIHVESARQTLSQGDRSEALAVIAVSLEEAPSMTRNRLCALLAVALVLAAEMPVPPRVELHVWTRHGHACCREAPLSPATRPTAVARCGGPGLCSKCSAEASAAHSRNTVIDD